MIDEPGRELTSVMLQTAFKQTIAQCRAKTVNAWARFKALHLAFLC
jgi:hypothetical protein